MNRSRKQSRDSMDGTEIFADADFDADEFVDEMDDKRHFKHESRASWRRLEEWRENRQLAKELNDLDWDDFDN